MTAAAGKTAAAAENPPPPELKPPGTCRHRRRNVLRRYPFWNSVTRNIFPEESGVMPYLPVIQRLDRSDILNGRLVLGNAKEP